MRVYFGKLVVGVFAAALMTSGIACAAPIVSFGYEFTIGSDTLSGITHPDLNFSGTVTFDLAAPDEAPASPSIGFYAIGSHVINLNSTPLIGGVINSQSFSKNQITIFHQSYFDPGLIDLVDFDSTVNATVGTASLWQIGLRFDDPNSNFADKSLFLPDPSNFGTLMATLYYDVAPGESRSIATSFHVTGFSDGAAVPVPAALPLFVSGLGVIGLLGWRKKRKKATSFVA